MGPDGDGPGVGPGGEKESGEGGCSTRTSERMEVPQTALGSDVKPWVPPSPLRLLAGPGSLFVPCQGCWAAWMLWERTDRLEKKTPTG